MQARALGDNRAWVTNGDQSIEGARRATRKLLSLAKPPTAIFCANDEMAMACIYELKRNNLSVPQDVSVVGFDDTRYAAIKIGRASCRERVWIYEGAEVIMKKLD